MILFISKYYEVKAFIISIYPLTPPPHLSFLMLSLNSDRLNLKSQYMLQVTRTTPLPACTP